MKQPHTSQLPAVQRSAIKGWVVSMVVLLGVVGPLTLGCSRDSHQPTKNESTRSSATTKHPGDTTPWVEVVDPGEQPHHNLVSTFAKGETQTYTLSTQVLSDPIPPSLDATHTQLEWDIQLVVLEVEPDGYNVAVTITDARVPVFDVPKVPTDPHAVTSNEMPNPQETLSKAVGGSVEVHVGKYGDLDFDRAPDPVELDEDTPQLRAVMTLLDSLVYPRPSQPVGPAAQWDVNRPYGPVDRAMRRVFEVHPDVVDPAGVSAEMTVRTVKPSLEEPDIQLPGPPPDASDSQDSIPPNNQSTKTNTKITWNWRADAILATVKDVETVTLPTAAGQPTATQQTINRLTRSS